MNRMILAASALLGAGAVARIAVDGDGPPAQPTAPYQPEVQATSHPSSQPASPPALPPGQARAPDVVYVPTPPQVVDAMLRQEDLFEADFSDATVVTLYLLEALNRKLRPRLLKELKPGTRIVSHVFTMGDWPPEKSANINGSMIYMWTIPKRV